MHIIAAATADQSRTIHDAGAGDRGPNQRIPRWSSCIALLLLHAPTPRLLADPMTMVGREEEEAAAVAVVVPR